LSVARTVLETTKERSKFGMQVDTKIKRRLFPFLLDLLCKARLRPLHLLLDLRRVNAPVLDQSDEGHARHFAP